jgi:hypothetical protein
MIAARRSSPGIFAVDFICSPFLPQGKCMLTYLAESTLSPLGRSLFVLAHPTLLLAARPARYTTLAACPAGGVMRSDAHDT